MNLSTFIEETLLSIVSGVRQAQLKGRQYQAEINPPLAYVKDEHGRMKAGLPQPEPEMLERLNLLKTHKGHIADMIEFDVAITIATGTAKAKVSDGGGGAEFNITVASASLGAKRTSSDSNTESSSHVSRVKFRIPVAFPG